MKKVLLPFISLVCLSSLSLAEFGSFGYDPQYDTPPSQEQYGEPKKTIPAKQVIIQNRKMITALKRRIADLEERLNGVTSLMEGLNATIAEMKMGNSMSGTVPQNSDENAALLKELGLMIDKINENYVSKEELAQILKGKKIEMTAKQSKSEKTTTSGSDAGEALDGKPTAKLYSEGVRLFVKQRYAEAKKRFIITDKKGYKPAASNYYLGEIAYYTKSYSDAIFFYKKSAGLYDQASYMDVLLLHTAISLEKTGDKVQAKSFYKNIIDNYPDKKSAKIAKEKLKRLKV